MKVFRDCLFAEILLYLLVLNKNNITLHNGNKLLQYYAVLIWLVDRFPLYSLLPRFFRFGLIPCVQARRNSNMDSLQGNWLTHHRNERQRIVRLFVKQIISNRKINTASTLHFMNSFTSQTKSSIIVLTYFVPLLDNDLSQYTPQVLT